MTISEFQRLGEDDQYLYWVTGAVQVSERESAEHYFALYQLDGFYVEMKFFKHSEEAPTMCIFSDEKALAPYLYRINISAAISKS